MGLISTKELIKILKEEGIDLGKGDPYNRLRYYTKIGWLPHMVRKKDINGEIIGHYSVDVIEKIKLIEDYKKMNKSNDEINNLININQNNTRYKILNSLKGLSKNININYLFISIILIGFLIEAIRYNSHNENIINNTPNEVRTIIPEKKIIDGGFGIIPTNQKTTFIPSSNITATSIIMLNFQDNIGYNNSYFIKEIKINQGFYIETNYPVVKESKFNWVVIE